jgi:serine/threonine protein kinase
LKDEAKAAHDRRLAMADPFTGDEDDEDSNTDILADFAVDFLEPSSSSDSLGRLGEIDILGVIGRGGMGIVLKGNQAELKRLVAVKVLAPHLAVSGAARKRFAREAQAAAAILHPNVMPILTVHSSGKIPFLVMPYLACESLQERINREGPLELLDILRIGMQAAQGLAAAHAQGLVHRDVKPANILLEKGIDRVMLTDFGLARAIDDASITRTGFIAGTPLYMSPEQARGEALDARSDLFSLGSVLYTMATGRGPFRAESTYGILRRITDDVPRPIRELNPQMPVWLVEIVDKLLSKDPSVRFASAHQVASLMERCLAHVQEPANVPLPDYFKRPPTLSVMRPARRLAVYVVAVSLAIGLLLWGTNGPKKNGVTHDRGQVASEYAERPAVTAPGDPLLKWDAAADVLNGLDQDGRQFESRVGRSWDR